MKTIGLIGGLSWESTLPYYKLINEEVARALGGLHSAKIILYSVDFGEVYRYQSVEDWDTCARILGEAAKTLEDAGADFLLIGTNTMHKIAPAIIEYTRLPLLHIADATADVLSEDDVRKVGLLGTRTTMTEPFYKDRLADRGFEVVVPGAEDIDRVNGVIFDELCLGQFKDTSCQAFVRIVEVMAEEGAEAVILGCTEIGLLLEDAVTPIPLYDTTQIHAKRAAALALADE